MCIRHGPLKERRRVRQFLRQPTKSRTPSRAQRRSPNQPTRRQRLRRQLRKKLQQRPCPNRSQRSRQARIESPQSRNLQQRRNQQRIARVHHSKPRNTASQNNSYRAINGAHVSCRSHHIRHQRHIRVDQLIRPNTRRWYSEDTQPNHLIPSPRHLFTQNLHRHSRTRRTISLCLHLRLLNTVKTALRIRESRTRISLRNVVRKRLKLS